jgi:molybdopterin converting factor small subunit
LLELPAKDLSEDRLRDHLHTLREDLYNPSKEMLSFLEDNADVRQEYIERLEELKDELQRRKDVGIIPDSEPSDSDSESSSSDSGDVQEDLNTSNTQSGGSADNGVDTSTSSATTNNQSSTGSDSFS